MKPTDAAARQDRRPWSRGRRARWTRRLLLALGGAMLALQAQAAPPAVVLHVDWRWVQTQRPPAVAGTADDGSRVTSTAGSFDTRPGFTLRSAPVDEAPIQRVRVMNGERASVRLATQAMRPQVLLWRGSRGDGGAVSMADAVRVRSFSVRPYWPGGRAPVSLQIEAASGDAAAPSQWSTKLPVPLGLWATVASVGDTGPDTIEPGTLSTRDAAPARLRELQVRVTR